MTDEYHVLNQVLYLVHFYITPVVGVLWGCDEEKIERVRRVNKKGGNHSVRPGRRKYLA